MLPFAPVEGGAEVGAAGLEAFTAPRSAKGSDFVPDDVIPDDVIPDDDTNCMGLMRGLPWGEGPVDPKPLPIEAMPAPPIVEEEEVERTGL